MRIRLASIATLIVALGAPGAAHAGMFPGELVTVPSPDIVRVDDVDLARDGDGAIAFVRRDGGVDHVYVTRLVGGAFRPAERVDAGLEGPAGQASIAASDGGRLAVAFVNAGQAFVSVRPSARRGWTAPQQLGAGATATAIDMSINGVAYVTFTAGGDLRAARLDRNAKAFTVLASPLDIDPALEAGAGTGRPRVALSADGTGVAVWGEGGHVYERRLVGLNVSPVPQDPVLAELDGHAGGAADLPDVDIEDNSSYAWVVFRQQFADGAATTSRGIARRLRGSRFEDPIAVDGLGWGGSSVEATDVDLSSRGEGLIATGDTGGPAQVAALRDDVFGPIVPVGGGGVPSQPVVAMAERGMRTAAWFAGGDPVTVHGRHYEDSRRVRTPPGPGPDASLTNVALGAVDPGAGLDAASDRLGNVVLAFVQAAPDGRRLVAAGFDVPPGAPRARSQGSGWLTTRRPLLRWSAARDRWGPIAYIVEIDGKVVATTPLRTMLPPKPLRNGVHRWRVTALDRHGNATPGKREVLRIRVKGHMK